MLQGVLEPDDDEASGSDDLPHPMANLQCSGT